MQKWKCSRDPVGAANALFEEMRIDCPTEANEPAIEAHQADGSAEKSAALKVSLN